MVIGRTADDGLAVGQRYTVKRLQSPRTRFPEPGEGFGAVRNAGWLTITAIDDLHALAVVDFTCDVIELGDYLEPFLDVILPTTADPIGEPQFDDRAHILFGVDRRESFGDGDLVSIDRGTASGIGAGARFAIYRDNRNSMPLVHIGEAVVVQAADMTSKAVLVRVSTFIESGDVAVPRL